MREQEESTISKDGLVGTVLFHALLLLLFGFLYLPLRVDSFQNEGILINFGTSDQGTGDVQPISENVPATSESQPDESQPEESSAEAAKQTPKPVSQTDVQKVKDEKAKALPTAEKNKDKAPSKKTSTKPKTKPKKDTKKPAKTPAKTTPSKPTTKPKTEKPAPKVPEKKEPEVDKSALFPGSKNNNSTGQGNSSDAKNEDLGSKMGKVDITPNTGTTSPGKGKSGVGASVAGRNALSLPRPSESSQEVGTVVIKIKVDQSGKVTDAKFQSAGSTTANPTLVKAAIAAAKKAKFNADVNAPALVSGTITYTFSLK